MILAILGCKMRQFGVTSSYTIGIGKAKCSDAFMLVIWKDE